MSSTDNLPRGMRTRLPLAMAALIVLLALGLTEGSGAAGEGPSGTASSTTSTTTGEAAFGDSAMAPTSGEPSNYRPDPAAPPTTVPLAAIAPTPVASAQTTRSVIVPALSTDGGPTLDGGHKLTYSFPGNELLSTEAFGGAVDPGLGANASALPSNYQFDHNEGPQGMTQLIYSFDDWVYIYERGCVDPQTCTGGVRKSHDYAWYMGAGVDFGLGPGAPSCYSFHAGVTMGNTRAYWRPQWGGYDVANPGCPFLANAEHGSYTRDEIQLPTQRWYRIRIWRLEEITPGTWSWGAFVFDPTAGQEYYMGAHHMINAPFITWMTEMREVVEDYPGPNNGWAAWANGPCTTDILGVHGQESWYQSVDGGPFPLPFATASYGTECSNTDLRPGGGLPNFTFRYTVNDRQATRQNSHGDYMWYPS